MSLFYFRDLDGKKRTYSTVTAAKKGARMFADHWGVAVEVFEEVGGTGRKVTARKNPTTRGRGGPKFFVYDLRGRKALSAFCQMSHTAAVKAARDMGGTRFFGVYPHNDYEILPDARIQRRNPAMLGGSVLSRSKAALASGYLALVKAARAKGSKRLKARPKRSVEHRTRADNSNSVLKTVQFKQPRGGTIEEVAGLTAKEAQKLANQLRNYGLSNVRVI